MTITIYQKPSCTTCRTVYKMLLDAGVDVKAVNYYVDPIPKEKFRELLKKMKITPRQLLRTSEPIYKEMALAGKELSDDALIGLMVLHPDLIQRPIVERGAKAILARPAERLTEII